MLRSKHRCPQSDSIPAIIMPWFYGRFFVDENIWEDRSQHGWSSWQERSNDHWSDHNGWWNGYEDEDWHSWCEDKQVYIYMYGYIYISIVFERVYLAVRY